MHSRVWAESPQRHLPVLLTPSPAACLVLPAEATCWPSQQAVHRKGGAKGLFHPLQGPFSCAFGFQGEKGLVLAAAHSPSFACASHLPPKCGSGSHQTLGGQGRASPEVVLEQLPQAGPRHWVWITEKGKSAGALACAKAAGPHRKNRLCKMRGRSAGLDVCNLGRGKGLPLRHATA